MRDSKGERAGTKVSIALCFRTVILYHNTYEYSKFMVICFFCRVIHTSMPLGASSSQVRSATQSVSLCLSPASETSLQHAIPLTKYVQYCSLPSTDHCLLLLQCSLGHRQVGLCGVSSHPSKFCQIPGIHHKQAGSSVERKTPNSFR